MSISRRDVLRTSAAAAAVAVPFSALASPASAGASAADLSAGEVEAELAVISGPVMFYVHDAAKGEVAILHGEEEVIVNDRRLVARIMRAARLQQMV
jgi:secreted PhoX family phosphatase